MQRAVLDRTTELIARAHAVQIEIVVAWATSCTLLEHARERQLSERTRRLIRGGSDVAVVAEAITDARLCVHCIARKTGVPAEEVNGLVTTLAGTIRIWIGPHRCDACLERRITFSLNKERPP
jgi:hypothetical protein